MTKIIVAKEKFDCEHLLGKYVDESNYDLLVEEDTDCYLPKSKITDSETDETSIAFKFRKNFFSKQEQEQAYIGLREAAVPSQNRGMAAGPRGEKLGGRDWVNDYQLNVLEFLSDQVDSVVKVNLQEEIEKIKQKSSSEESTRGLVWLSAKVKKDNFKFDAWLNNVIKLPIEERKKQVDIVVKTYISETNYAASVNSGIAGWFDRYPRIPYGRATAYTQNNPDKFKMAFPFLQSLARGFKELLPMRYNNQMEAARKIDPRFCVPRTPFTTITVNKTFRTACHRDAGDLSSGLSNLLVLSNNGNYSGGYLVFPEVRMAVNVRPGDLLLVNNHEIIHGNTPIVLNDAEAERISLVCYFREKMLELGSYEYENLRFEFVESRRKNKEHPLWKPLWNGINPSMWESDEWFDYLDAHASTSIRKGEKDKIRQKISSLEDFF